jgi:hypothetical protein
MSGPSVVTGYESRIEQSGSERVGLGPARTRCYRNSSIIATSQSGTLAAW